MTDARPRPGKSAKPHVDTVIELIESGEFDEYLMQITRALETRNEQRKEQALQLVKLLWGEKAEVIEDVDAMNRSRREWGIDRDAPIDDLPTPDPARAAVDTVKATAEREEAEPDPAPVIGDGDAVVTTPPSAVDGGAAGEFQSADITPGLPTAFGSDFRASQGGGIAPATAGSDVSEGGGEHVIQGGTAGVTVIGGDSGQGEIQSHGAQIGDDDDMGTHKGL